MSSCIRDYSAKYIGNPCVFSLLMKTQSHHRILILEITQLDDVLSTINYSTSQGIEELNLVRLAYSFVYTVIQYYRNMTDGN